MLRKEGLSIEGDFVDPSVSSLEADIDIKGTSQFGRQPVGAGLVVSGLAIRDLNLHRELRGGVPESVAQTLHLQE